MDRVVRCALAAFMGFLLVGVRGAVYDSLHGAGISELQALAGPLSYVVGLVGASVTVVFAIPVLTAGWGALRGGAGAGPQRDAGPPA